ncbi:hypothetical protein SAMN04487911_13010 [Arenibacter nanhaiticus]|uniref:SHOCT domain-containing protein n=1 Tax=Arenibacter nanhaiticus TaxID=558155 RepID=A0A1M6L7K1_9FLAO|nr:hypothetical protein [Arenibacter nanhaiticus]SHJ67183.1 hypothetical protein SAMN04487911_13010 [Arenibacter nanhaiticus]
MKKLLLAIISLTATTAIAQKQLDELSFEDSQNASVFQQIKNNTKILKYTAADGSVLAVGDTLVIGYPSGSTTSTTAVGGGYRVGAAKARSKTKSSFQTIIMGKPAGFGNVMAAMGGEEPNTAGAEMQGEIVVISEMSVFHKGSRKKPLKLTVLLGDPNGRAFGINKYMSVTDYEKSVLSGEIKSINAPMTREEAIAKLKESKDLLDLGIMAEDEYQALKEELTPIIKSE